MTTTPTLAQLQRAIVISEQIEALQAEMKGIFSGSAPSAKAAPTAKAAPAKTGTFKRSPETIAKMKASQQARWAKLKAPASAKTPAKKGGMSPEGRAAIVAAQKARWAKIKGTNTPVIAKAPAKAKAAVPVKKKRKPMSPAVKAKLAAAMKKRWADAKAGKGPAPTASKKK